MEGFRGNLLQVEEYVYDFAKDGGVVSTISLSGKDNAMPVPVGAIVRGCMGLVVTACTSGGSATVAWGNGDDADGYSGAGIAVASLTERAVFNGWDGDAALLWDGTNDHAIFVPVVDAADGAVSVTIATAALTAGKIALYLEVLYPGL